MINPSVTFLVLRLMLWIFFASTQLLFSFSISYHLLWKTIPSFHIALISIPVALVGCSFVELVAACLLSLERIPSLLLTGVYGIASIALLRKSKGSRYPLKGITNVRILVICTGSIFSVLCVLLSYDIRTYSFMLSNQDDILADLSMTESFVHGINGVELDIDHIHSPACLKCRVFTEFLISFHTSNLVRSGAPIALAFPLDHILLLISAFSLSNLFIFETVRYFPVAIFAIWCFYNLGGFSYIDALKANISTDFFGKLPNGKIGYARHPLISFYAGSRNLAAAASVGVSVLLITLVATNRSTFCLLGFISAASLCVSHSCGLSILLYLMLFSCFRKHGCFWYTLGGAIFPFVYFWIHTRNIDSPKPISIQPIFNQSSGFVAAKFWFNTTGLFVFAMALVIPEMIGKKSMPQLLSAAIVFLIGNFLNLSVFSSTLTDYFRPICYLVFVSNIFAFFIARRMFILSILFAVIHGLSGVLGVFNNSYQRVPIFTQDQIATAQWLAANAEGKDAVLYTPVYPNPIHVIAGLRTLHSDHYEMLRIRTREDISGSIHNEISFRTSYWTYPQTQWAVRTVNGAEFVNDFDVTEWRFITSFGNDQIFKRVIPKQKCCIDTFVGTT